MSIGGLENSGESAGIGVLGMGDIGGEVDIGDREEEGHGDGENGEEEDDMGERGAEEHVESESECMVSLTGQGLVLVLSVMLSQSY